MLLWPAISLALVAANYAALGQAGFQKRPNGRMSIAARLLLAPYLLGAYANSRLWTRRDPAPAEVAPGVWIGRIPSRHDLDVGYFVTVLDLAAELPRLGDARRYHALPVLDLTTPPPETLSRAAEIIERSRAAGPVLVCCALGYSRSAAAVATWALRSRVCSTVDAAVETVRMVRPRIVLDASAEAAIVAAAKA